MTKNAQSIVSGCLQEKPPFSNDKQRNGQQRKEQQLFSRGTCWKLCGMERSQKAQGSTETGEHIAATVGLIAV